MTKLNYFVISKAPSRINPVQDRELILRGLKATEIENLALTKDQNDTLDLQDNDIARLENFPPMKRLSTLLLSNNRISKIDGVELGKNLPNLNSLMLMNNLIEELGELDALKGLKKLEFLCLLDNPVVTKSHYREYLIYKLPTLRVLDFKRITEKERLASKKTFGGSQGKKLEETISSRKSGFSMDGHSKTFEPGQMAENRGNAREEVSGLTPEEKERIKKAIAQAKSFEEIQILERQLQAGYVPSVSSSKTNNTKKDDKEEGKEKEKVAEENVTTDATKTAISDDYEKSTGTPMSTRNRRKKVFSSADVTEESNNEQAEEKPTPSKRARRK